MGEATVGGGSGAVSQGTSWRWRRDWAALSISPLTLRCFFSCQVGTNTVTSRCPRFQKYCTAMAMPRHEKKCWRPCLWDGGSEGLLPEGPAVPLIPRPGAQARNVPRVLKMPAMPSPYPSPSETRSPMKS